MPKLKVTVPAQALRGHALPALGLCPRHGAPASSVRSRTFWTRTPIWAFLLIGVLAMFLRKQVDGPVPECGTCAKERRRYRQAVAAAWVTAFAVLVVGVGRASTSVLIAGSFMLLGALILTAISEEWRVQGVLSRDQLWLTLKGVHPAFVQAAQTAMHQAAQAPALAHQGFPPYQGYPATPLA
jgi:hypothetical protein